MKPSITYLLKTITATAVICLLSCDDNLGAINKMQLGSNEPIGELSDMLLKYTDSGKMKVELAAPTMLDFSNDAFPYSEFPDGVDITVYDRETDTLQTTNIIADYGIKYDETQLIDLRGNVVIVNSDGTTFRGDQLYFDQRREWLFSDKKFQAELEQGLVTGDRFDSDLDMTNLRIRNSNDIFNATELNE